MDALLSRERTQPGGRKSSERLQGLPHILPAAGGQAADSAWNCDAWGMDIGAGEVSLKA
jgi:hypothetical protein